MKKYEKPQLLIADFKISQKPICAEALISSSEGTPSSGGIFRPALNSAIYKENK